MDPAAILSLLSDLYLRVVSLTAENEALKAQIQAQAQASQDRGA